jgi:hypothetical protein
MITIKLNAKTAGALILIAGGLFGLFKVIDLLVIFKALVG